MSIASKTLKCSNCNIVICEVLAFVQNKLDVMDEQSLIQICESAFSEDEIDKAKSLLFESVSKRPSIRKRKGKTLRNIEDIICLLKETDPEQIPIFVAKRLEKLPPVTFDHVDVTPLLKKILTLEKSMQCIQNEYVSRNELINTLSEYSKTKNHRNNVNIKRGGGTNFCDSGPMEISAYCDFNDYPSLSRNRSPAKQASDTTRMQPLQATSAAPTAVASLTTLHDQRTIESAREIKIDCAVSCSESIEEQQVIVATKETAERPRKQPYDKNTVTKDCNEDSKATYSEVARKGGTWIEPKKSEEWVLYQKRRLRNRLISQKGSANETEENNQKFKAADIKVPLFISNVDREVSEQDIINYVYGKTKEKVSLEKINMKRQKDYNAYKVYVTKHKMDTFLDDKLWPIGITFRRFVNFHEKRKNMEIVKRVENKS